VAPAAVGRYPQQGYQQPASRSSSGGPAAVRPAAGPAAVGQPTSTRHRPQPQPQYGQPTQHQPQQPQQPPQGYPQQQPPANPYGQGEFSVRRRIAGSRGCRRSFVGDSARPVPPAILIPDPGHTAVHHGHQYQDPRFTSARCLIASLARAGRRFASLGACRNAPPVAGIGRAMPEVMSQSLRRAAVWTGAVAAVTGACSERRRGRLLVARRRRLRHPVSPCSRGARLLAASTRAHLDGVPPGWRAARPDRGGRIAAGPGQRW